jgi:hypothetical protein
MSKRSIVLRLVQVALATTGTTALGAAAFLVGAWTMTGPDDAGRPGFPVAGSCREAPVVTIEDAGIRGRARLCRSAAGVSASMAAAPLRIGDTYAVWPSYIDPAVSGGARPLGESRDNRPDRFSARLGQDVAGTTEGYFTGELPGLAIPDTAHVTLALFERGPEDPEQPRGATHRYPGAPTPLPWATGGIGPGTFVASAAFRFAGD